MPRTAASIAPDAIRIEEEVWQEAFDQRVPRPRRRRPTPAPAPARRTAPARPPRPAPARPAARVELERSSVAVEQRPAEPAHVPAGATTAGPDLRLVSAPARPFDYAAESATSASSATATSSTDTPTRRTVTIKGRGAERNLPWEAGISPRRSTRLPHHRSTFRPDRLAMWAMVLGLLLVLVAAISAH